MHLGRHDLSRRDIDHHFQRGQHQHRRRGRSTFRPRSQQPLGAKFDSVIRRPLPIALWQPQGPEASGRFRSARLNIAENSRAERAERQAGANRAQVGGADITGFLDDQLPARVESGARSRKHESEQQSQQGENGTIDWADPFPAAPASSSIRRTPTRRPISRKSSMPRNKPKVIRNTESA